MTKRAIVLLALTGLFACKHEPEAPPPPNPPTLADTMSDGGAAVSAAPPADATDAASPTADLSDASATDAAAPPPAAADLSAPPGYPSSALHDTFAKASDKLVACYLPGKKRDPKLRGKVIVKFSVGTSGRSGFAQNEGSTLPDDAVVACVVKVVKSLHYTKPVEGSVTVVYPFIFRPGDQTLILPESAPPK